MLTGTFRDDDGMTTAVHSGFQSSQETTLPLQRETNLEHQYEVYFPTDDGRPGGNETCSNCKLYTGADGKKFGPCSLFSYKRDTRSVETSPTNIAALLWSTLAW